ncbi:MAG: chromate transporter [Rubrivivax sp.]|nr:chromate transporter [Rubrivivax sp.]MDP3225347.1 chromate transporter [Rubrivivax sp.]MDP3610635.1 chromate transporter [Rubrivivax sp.]
MSAADSGQAARPARVADLFWAFNRLALQGFGGVLPVAQRELVERLRWLSREQFLELLSLSQVLPGPNIVNLGLILGDRFFGWRGGLAAVAGMLLAPTALVLALAAAAMQLSDVPQVAGALRGMGIVAAGLILSTALKLAPGLRRNVIGIPAAALLMALTVLGIGVLRWPLAAVVLGLGVVAVAWAWWRSAP